MFNIGFKYGLLAAVILVGTWMITLGLGLGNAGTTTDAWAGWIAILLSLTTVYLAIRAYRMSTPQKTVAFTPALAVGAIVVVLVTIVYVIGWEVRTGGDMTSFMADYSANVTAELQAAGATPEEIAAEQETVSAWGALYDSALTRWVLFAGEILPVGLLFSLVASFVESRRR